VKNKSAYSDTHVDDADRLVGFGEAPPPAFKLMPFFVGAAHAGHHVFPGRKGDVIEAHSTRLMNDRANMELSPFNPLAEGGGPRWTELEKYRSGLIAVPPGL
jgi:hypothetical protein